MIDLITLPNMRFTSEELHYTHRMKPFADLGSPAPLSFEDYQRISTPRDVSANYLLKDALLYFNLARTRYAELLKVVGDPALKRIPELVEQHTTETKALISACIGNTLLINNLLKLGTSKTLQARHAQDKKLVVEAKYSTWFPFIILVDK